MTTLARYGQCPTPISPPLRGAWFFSGYPETFTLQALGREFQMERTYVYLQPPGVVASYRSSSSERSLHLYVKRDGTCYYADHFDCHNPTKSFDSLVKHVEKDMGVSFWTAAFGLIGIVGVAIAVSRQR